MTAQVLTLLRRHSARNPLGRLAHALSLRRQRNRLAGLDDHLLRDIGLTRQQAQHESTQTLWPAPDHWRF